MYSAIGVEPTKLTACTRIFEQRIDGFLVAVDDVVNAVRQARFLEQLAINMGALGSFSDGFRTNVLPQAIAIGNIHIGTIAGKLNGVMPATTPSGWKSDQLSMFGPTFFVCSPFSNSGMPQA